MVGTATASNINTIIKSIWVESTINPDGLIIHNVIHDIMEEEGLLDSFPSYLARPPIQVQSSCGLKLNLIIPGDFYMGDQKKKDLVRITDAFYMGETTVTQQQYKEVMGINPSAFSAEGRNADRVEGIDTSDFPVECVSWYDSQEFCKRLTKLDQDKGIIPEDWEYTLPTEAEWEYACRAGTTTLYNVGDILLPTQANCYESGLNRTCAVKSYPPNSWGLYEMHGNVWEWCLDSYS